MDFVLMLQSPGYIFGPLMLLGGLIAVAVCVGASLQPTRPLARRALIWSLVPVALGVTGAVVGATVWALSDQVMGNRDRAWAALGYTMLFGVLVATVPAVWSFVLLRRRPPVPA